MLETRVGEAEWSGRMGSIRMGSTVEDGFLARQPVDSVRALRQVHGREVLDDDWFAVDSPVGDGLVSCARATALVIRTADCVPIFLTDGRQMALLHGGWRGVKAGIVQAGVAKFGRPAEVWAVLGPAICGRHYEVDRDLYGAWQEEDDRVAEFLVPVEGSEGKRLFDLRGLIGLILEDLGVLRERTVVIEMCTFEGPLPSYRREGTGAGRIINYIFKT